MSSSGRLAEAAALLLGVTACLGETELITLPPPPPTTLTLAFRALAADEVTARALGWENGIPDVAVTLTPEDGRNHGRRDPPSRSRTSECYIERSR